MRPRLVVCRQPHRTASRAAVAPAFVLYIILPCWSSHRSLQAGGESVSWLRHHRHALSEGIGMHCLPLFLALLLLAASATSGEMQHALDARLLPLTGKLVATAVITLPAAATATRHEFELQADLEIVDADPPVARVSSTDGVYLDGNSGWYPTFDDALLTFSLDVELPPGWTAISQGVRSRHTVEHTRTREHWQETQPQEEIYLIAAAFHEYRIDGSVDKMVLLREADPALAQKYLAVMDEYLDLYSRLLGPYPYGKFALVENSWESGYGMPSFTLLGPRVIRLPFILRSSFPHEI